jgi:ABC-2 type transport system ATP-binding protein|tara:strand:- start:429 stop:1382 length:954 start_codon:yes stop_codon:yes gene_type:complete
MALERAIELSGVRKVFANVVAVDNLSLEVQAGSIYGFLGPNGAGKSTTIRMLTGILRASEGVIRVLDQDPGEVKRQLGYLPEEKGLYKKMRVKELIQYFGRLKGLESKVAEQKCEELLKKFELDKWADQKCESLSKGMGQKVQIIATLIHDPELIVLDEPFSGLDPVSIELVREIILELKRTGRTVVFSTHMMEQAEQLCDSVLLINRGQKVIDGFTNEVRAEAGDTLRLDYEGDGSILKSLPGVVRLNDAGRHAELTLAPQADTQKLLALLIGKITITRFDISSASLHEVFVRSIATDIATQETNTRSKAETTYAP